MANIEWTIVCNHCGQFYYIGPEPVLCPKCHDTEIDVYPQYELEVSDHEDDLSDGHMNDVRFGSTLDETGE